MIIKTTFPKQTPKHGLKQAFISFFILALSPLISQAEIITDGSVGAASSLQGSNFLIPSELGLQKGQNLFHSFAKFNIDTNETAHFLGNSAIQQVLVRISDNKTSYIDGLISSDMSADFFFLNSNGFLFGANAKLDLGANINFAGADYLRQSDNKRLYSDLNQDSQFSAASVAAFGFFAGNDSQIQLIGKGQLETDTALGLLADKQAGIQLKSGQDLNLIAQHISSAQGSYYIDTQPDNNGKPSHISKFLPLLQLQNNAQLNLLAVASAGEARIKATGLDARDFTQLGNIDIQEQSAIKISGQDAGSIQIQADTFLLDDSEIGISAANNNPNALGSLDILATEIHLDRSGQIASLNQGSASGANIAIIATNRIHIDGQNQDSKDKASLSSSSFASGNTGNILLQAANIDIESAKIEATAFNSGDGGQIRLIAEQKINLNQANVAFSNFSRGNDAGRGGRIIIQAPHIQLSGKSMLNGGAFGKGDAGDIYLEGDNILIGGDSRLFADAVFGSGNGGLIEIDANTIAITEGSYIEVTAKNFFGEGGRININARERLSLSGTGGNGEASAIKAGSQPFFKETTAGKGGTIDITAGNLDLNDGSTISNNSSAGDNIRSGDAGNIRINVNGETLITGANPHGENREGFGSGIYAQVLGVDNNTGNGGNIELNTGTLRLEHGGVIKTSTNNQSAGGSIVLNVTNNVLIQGEATEADISKAPESRQRLYIQEFVPQQINQSISGIYAETNSSRNDAGQGGNIELEAGNIHLADKGQISTTSQGGGTAGNISLNTANLKLDSSASIHSDSQFYNRFVFDSLNERDQTMLKLGDVVEVQQDTGTATGYYLNVGDEMLRINYQYQTADLNSLAHLASEYSLFNGDIVQVKATGDRYIYNSSFTQIAFKWVRIDTSRAPIEFANAAELSTLNNWNDEISRTAPYPNGTYLRVLDMGNGKPADFIYLVYPDRNPLFSIAQAVQIRQYFLSETTELQNLAKHYFLDTGDHALILDQSDQVQNRYIYNGTDWVQIQDLRTVPDNKARQALILSQPGGQVHINANTQQAEQDFIYNGKIWINSNKTTSVQNLQQRDSLNSQHGDIVEVADIGSGQYEAYFFENGQWTRQYRGGNAGSLDINISQRLQMGENTKISTESSSAGGGSIQIRADQGYDIYRANISTSVQEGVGNSGNLKLDGQAFIALNQGQIIAQADAGKGGNISLNSPYYLPSNDSLISASSRLGIDGEIIINSPTNDISSPLVVMASSFLSQPELALNQCAIDQLSALSRFNIKLEYDGKAKSPQDLQD